MQTSSTAHALPPGRRAKRGRKASALLAVIIVLSIVLVGMAAMIQRNASSRAVTQTRNNKLLANNLAEAACSRALETLQKVSTATDPIYHEPRFHEFTAEEFDDYVASVFLPVVNGPENFRSADLRAPNDGSYRVVALRRSAGPNGDSTYTVTGEGVYRDPATGREATSVVELDSRFLFDAERLGGAIVSDMPNLGLATGGGKLRAKDGNVVLGRGNGFIAVMGRVMANGAVFNGTGQQLNESNFGQAAHAIQPVRLGQELYGTKGEVPDHTRPGESKQLFDFERFIAAADAGAGVHYPSLEAFAEAANNGEPMNGIVVVDVDPAAYVRKQGVNLVVEDPILVAKAALANKPNKHYVPSVDVRGTLLFNIAPTFTYEGVAYPTPEVYSVVLDTPLRVNPASVSDVDAYVSEVNAYTDAVNGGETGLTPPLPPTGGDPYEAGSLGRPLPWEVVLGGGLSSFQPGDDLPALMLNMGTLDINAEANISGVVYSPGYAEIENRNKSVQYINGMLIAGGGVFLEDQGNPGRLALVFDQARVDHLATAGLAMKAPAVVAWRQIK